MSSNAENLSTDTDSENTDLNLSDFEKRFHNLYENNVNCDCEFIVGSERVVVKGHKLLFATASDVFQAMFYGELREDNTVTINDLHPDGFQGMKLFIYTGKVNFESAVNALLTLAAARKYILPELSIECTEYITEEGIQASELLQFYEYGKLYLIPDFDELCCKIIQEQTHSVLHSDYFPQAQFETMEVILKSSSLEYRSEIDVFNIFSFWVTSKNSEEKICDQRLNNLKKCIRFLTLSREEFVSEVADSFLLTEEESTAIAWNLLKPGSRPLPETISPEQQYRDSTNILVQQAKYEFTLSLDDLTSSFNVYTLPNKRHPKLTHQITYSVIRPNKNDNYRYICFLMEPLTTMISSKDCTWLTTMKSKLRVVADDALRDLWLENTTSVEIDWKKKEHQKVIFAKIEVSKLKNKCFLRDTKDTVIIQGFFHIYCK